ncbi:HipA domain-containing protein [Aliihoeflea sp. PC F10.4]
MIILEGEYGERHSYPESLMRWLGMGLRGKAHTQALYRRVAFDVLISNVDDHLRNHGFSGSAVLDGRCRLLRSQPGAARYQGARSDDGYRSR